MLLDDNQEKDDDDEVFVEEVNEVEHPHRHRAPLCYEIRSSGVTGYHIGVHTQKDRGVEFTQRRENCCHT
mgnify:CR=1 FL=1